MLPNTWEKYLESLERTDRKELKRKIKRIETVPHSLRIFEYSESTEEDFETFIKLHKLSDHSKDQFMTDPMKAFFKDLFYLSIPNWKQKLAFLFVNDIPIASIFYFESSDSILLYNSGYDPEQKYYSGGLLLAAYLIRHAIEKKMKLFDFLRGNERYKYDLGGKDVQLYKFICTL
ncbi:MAG: GNAT family N-acetyltransferase [Candidatus Roizmanbacteria bacterium]|nr:GNAT family N-acetyltransferase [Candidatus Roizmanbacteria bacterium]